MIVIHPDAEIHFNEKVRRLAALIKKYQPRQESAPSFVPERAQYHAIASKDILAPALISETNHKDEEVGRYYNDQGSLVGLAGSDYREFSILCEKIQKIPSIRNTISLKTIQNHIFNWCSLEFRKQAANEPMQYVLEKASSEVHDYEIWFPMAYTFVQSDMNLCNIEFRTISSSTIYSWSTMFKKDDEEISEESKLFFKDIETKFLGKAAVFVRISAESQRAIEIGRNSADIAVRILNFLHPHAQYADIASYSTLAGKAFIPYSETILSSPINFQTSSSFEKSPKEWHISNEQIIDLRHQFYNLINSIYATPEESHSKFQKLLIDSFLRFLLYVFTSSPEQKLIYILSALESMLLKNRSEPIQGNVADRMAFFLSQDPTERLRIIEDFKRTYDLRSSYVHHGLLIEELESVERFIADARHFFHKAFHCHDKYSTIEEFLKMIDQIKYS